MQLIYTVPNNLNLLHEQLLAAFPAWGSSLVVMGKGNNIILTVPDGASAPAVDAIITAHVASGLSANQVLTAKTAQAQADYAGIPQLYGLTPAQADAWVLANVVDLASAKVVLRILARAVVALSRNNQIGG